MRRGRADAVIVGAGVIGCAIARELALRGLDVIAFDQNVPGRQASWAAAGMLSPFGEAGVHGPALDLSDASLDLYAAFADALRDESGIDIEYRTHGRLYVSLGDADDDLRAIASSPAATRFDVRTMDAAAAHRVQPALSKGVTAALLIGRDHRVNNRLMAQALGAAAVAAGADIRPHRRVTTITVRAGTATGAMLATGERIDADRVIVAAGAWSGRVEGLPRPLPVRPVRGQMFAVDASASTRVDPREAAERPVTFSRHCYIVPRRDGRLLVGATVEDVGFDAGPTPAGIGGLIAAATAVMPSIADLPLIESWAGFRPCTPDGLPIIGEDPDVAGLIYATGHFRNGILLAPVTGASMAALITGGDPPVPLEPFSPVRFST